MSGPAVATKRYGKGLCERSIKVWKRVRDEGGWWTASELALQMGLDTEEVRASMRNMVNNQYLAERVNTKNQLRRVGVTSFCYPPKGETLEPGRSPESWGA